MATGFPHSVGGRVSDETFDQIKQAEAKFHVTEGAMVRAALEAFMPGFLAGGSAKEFSAKVAEAVENDPRAKAEVEKILRRCEIAKRKNLTPASSP